MKNCTWTKIHFHESKKAKQIFQKCICSFWNMVYLICIEHEMLKIKNVNKSYKSKIKTSKLKKQINWN